MMIQGSVIILRLLTFLLTLNNSFNTANPYNGYLENQ